ncbi:hypothetical protein B0I00_1433 [Novosphingobium kunmingense]|uniref:Uncharacterized protein n=1 Tax=Novosphingobium kunmingense TaxID=1211806 RepID=A0A2N0HJT1_9SPHN|nr:hypothetical protein [Novosphingobium kunmingense]PKB19203.1 hypothetical protein B0I00_1433 [Novosphingobium kunmingense]
MRRIGLALIAATLAAGAPSAMAAPRQTGEERLAKMLEGREAGKPVSCISQMAARDQTVIDKTALVYKSGSTIWVNRPRNAEDVDDDDILVVYPTGGSFCRLDRVQTLDRPGHFITGFLMLDDFVPYRRVAARD